MESVPYGFAGSTQLLKIIAPGSMERVNISIWNETERGRKIIKEAGGVETYDGMARAEKGPKKPEFKIEEKSQIVFED
jgi:hypothetical protein